MNIKYVTILIVLLFNNNYFGQIIIDKITELDTCENNERTNQWVEYNKNMYTSFTEEVFPEIMKSNVFNNIKDNESFLIIDDYLPLRGSIVGFRTLTLFINDNLFYCKWYEHINPETSCRRIDVFNRIRSLDNYFNIKLLKYILGERYDLLYKEGKQKFKQKVNVLSDWPLEVIIYRIKRLEGKWHMDVIQMQDYIGYGRISD